MPGNQNVTQAVQPTPSTISRGPAAPAPAGAMGSMTPAWGYRWALELRSGEGEVLGSVPVAFDPEPARSWLGLMSLRSHGTDDSTQLGAVAPIWHPSHGPPYLSGFRATSGPSTHEFPVEYFGEAAIAAGDSLVTEGRIRRGDRVRYIPLAFAAPESRTSEPGRFEVEEIPVPPGVRPGSLADHIRRSDPVPSDPSDHAAGDPVHGRSRDSGLPVFVPSCVLDEAVTLARRSGDVEAGGILLGTLRFDAAAPEAFLEISALIEAPHTRAAADHVTFTAETWSAVRGTIGLRARDERMVGWYHSHPAHAWCRSCPDEARRRCRLARGFFSPDDRLLHRTVFPAAWSVGLLVTRTALGSEFHTMFGWHEGSIGRRGYHVLRGGAGPSGDASHGRREEHDA